MAVSAPFRDTAPNRALRANDLLGETLRTMASRKRSLSALAAVLLVTTSASATGAGPPDMSGLLAAFVAVVSIVPLLLLEWSIVRAKVGRPALYLALPAFVFVLMLVATIIAVIYQGGILGIDGAAAAVFLAWTAFRVAVFKKHRGKQRDFSRASDE